METATTTVLGSKCCLNWETSWSKDNSFGVVGAARTQLKKVLLPTMLKITATFLLTSMSLAWMKLLPFQYIKKVMSARTPEWSNCGCYPHCQT